MKYEMKNINWNEAPMINPAYTSDEKIQSQWKKFLTKYNLPSNTPHPSEQDWYVEEGKNNWDTSLTVLATPEAVKLYNDIIDLEDIEDYRIDVTAYDRPLYHFGISDTNNDMTMGVIGLGGDKFKVQVWNDLVPRQKIKPFIAKAATIKKFLDNVYEDGLSAALSKIGVPVDNDDVAGFAKGGIRGSTSENDNNMPKNWWAESLTESFKVKFGYEDKPEQSFDTLEKAVAFINDGMKKKDSKSYALFDEAGKEMIWLDQYRDGNDRDVGYTISRQNDKKSIEFDKTTKVLKIKQEEVKLEDNKAMRDIIVSELFKIKGYSAGQFVNKCRFVDSQGKPTSIDFDAKIVYYDDYAERPDIAKDILTQYKAKNESLKSRNEKQSELNQLKESLGSDKFNKIQKLIRECLKEGMEIEITIPKKNK